MQWNQRQTPSTLMMVIALSVTAPMLAVPRAGADVLDDLAATPGLMGSFVQQVISDEGDVLTESQGDFALRRPGLFRWEVTSPDRQLLIVDGKDLWQWDRDLETALRRPIPEEGTSPLQLLTAERADVEARYRVSTSAGGLLLVPRGDNRYFSSLTVRGTVGEALQLSLEDGLGQTILIDLTIDQEQLPEAEQFRFDPPDDVQWLEGAPNGAYEPR